MHSPKPPTALGRRWRAEWFGARRSPDRRKLKSGQHRVEVPLYLAPKLALYTILRERGISKSELARRLGCRETVVRRMLDLKHDTKPEKLAAALEALGKRLLVSMEEAA